MKKLVLTILCCLLSVSTYAGSVRTYGQVDVTNFSKTQVLSLFTILSTEIISDGEDEEGNPHSSTVQSKIFFSSLDHGKLTVGLELSCEGSLCSGEEDFFMILEHIQNEYPAMTFSELE